MNLPVDFEEKVKMPPPANGLGAPYQISAKDLMQDFRYAALQVGEGLTEDISPNGIRTVSLDGGGSASSGLPEGELGDMLYYGADEWRRLPSAQTSQDEEAILIFGAYKPEWKTLDIKTLQYVGDNNTAESGLFYMIPEPEPIE